MGNVLTPCCGGPGDELRPSALGSSAMADTPNALSVDVPPMHRAASAPVNVPDQGPFGLGVLPHVKDLLKAGFLKAYLTRLYNTELGTGPQGACRPNSAVAHASLDPEMNTMNIAMPDLTAEYWCTFVPPGQAPVFRLKFPEWSVYSALTAYDTAGFPVASLNARQVAGGTDPRMLIDSEGRVVVHLMHGTTWDHSAPLCVLFRVYRPEGVDITPHDDLPHARLVSAASSTTPLRSKIAKGLDWQGFQDSPASSADDLMAMSLEDVLNSTDEFEGPVPQEEALQRGRVIGEDFNEVISSKIKALHQNQYGSQFFYPNSVGGLFVNANATYVIAFLGTEHHGMKITTKVPEKTRFRPFYGYMAISYTTTETVGSLVGEREAELGGWGAEYTLYVAKTEEEAKEFSDYDPLNKAHRLLLWGPDCDTPGLVLRYLHYFAETTDLAEDELEASNKERELLTHLDGTRAALGKVQQDGVPGIGEIEYW
mmetsp:Transcript_72013/g.204406  ORF Transcript_72013/g.204406 Transcript_72013/m.204406 type:complete len:483 (-) Transcript_72013:121-1569(-)